SNSQPAPKSPQALTLALRLRCSRMAPVKRRSTVRECEERTRRLEGEAKATLVRRFLPDNGCGDPARVAVPSEQREPRGLPSVCDHAALLPDNACQTETHVTHSKQRTGVMSTRHCPGAPSSSKPKSSVNQNQVFIAVSHSKQTNEITNKCQEFAIAPLRYALLRTPPHFDGGIHMDRR